jgi:hypothetical protein
VGVKVKVEVEAEVKVEDEGFTCSWIEPDYEL